VSITEPGVSVVEPKTADAGLAGAGTGVTVVCFTHLVMVSQGVGFRRPRAATPSQGTPASPALAASFVAGPGWVTQFAPLAEKRNNLTLKQPCCSQVTAAKAVAF
jgi:hypothetical protein